MSSDLDLNFDLDLFWSKANKDGPTMPHMDSPCWEWMGARNHNYGVFRGKRANRVAVMITQGPIPDGLVARHMCDNPPCVNPSHLLLGTQGDNNRDARERGRHPVAVKTSRLNMLCPDPIARSLNFIAKKRGRSLAAQLLLYVECGLRRDGMIP